MSEEGPTLGMIACMPVDTTEITIRRPDLPPPAPHPGSTIVQCEGCRTDMWLGPNQEALTLEKVQELGIPATSIIFVKLCMLCAIAATTTQQIRTGREVPIMSVTVEENP